MRARRFTISLFIFIFLMSAQKTMAEEQQVEFHAFSSFSPDVGVQVIISVTYPDQTTQKFPTGKNGRVVMTLKSCDPSVNIEARSIWGDHTKTSKTCDPVPVKLAMIPSIQANAVMDVLRLVRQGSDAPLSGEAESFFVALREAVDSTNVAAAAVAANNLQWSLYVAGETRSAYEYGVFAQSAGFEAIALSDTISTGPTEGEVINPMVVDHARNLVVMSETGRSFLTQAQRELGVVETGTWDPQTFRALGDVGRESNIDMN